MTFITGYFQKFSLLILAIAGLTACSQESTQGNNATINSELIHSVDPSGLDAAIKESSKPYVLVNFYATWCKPCRVELPGLVEMHNNSPDVTLILVSIDDQEAIEEELAGFLQQFQVDFESFYSEEDPEKLLKDLYPEWNGTIPVNLLYTKDGIMLEGMGMTDPQEVEMLINQFERSKM